MIANEFIAKIEGHGSLSVDWDSNSVKLNIHEGERLFEGILVGRTAEEAHWITPRICGVCPIAHNLASLYAIEDAYGIKVSEGVKLLRKLMICGQMIQSHVLHLFFLVLPDYIGIDRGTELAKKKPASFKKALSLKELGDEIAHVVAGRNVHPVKSTVGGFHQAPTKKMLEDLLAKLVQTEKNAEWTVKVFSELKYPEIRVDLELVAQSGDKIVSNAGKEVLIKDYKKNIEEELRDYSTAKFGKFQGREMFVGSLARLAVLNLDIKCPSELGHLMSKLNFQNPFHNNIAQAIEILQYHKQAHEIIEKLLDSEIDLTSTPGVDVGVIARTPDVDYRGIGAVEAPRGGLYHEMHFDPGQEQRITYANIITPTVQNLTSIEKSASALLEQIQGSNQERQRLLNMLVRAYDPCITCSVH